MTSLGKDKMRSLPMRGLPSILSIFRNGFNKFNDTGARTSYFIYHVTDKRSNVRLGEHLVSFSLWVC